MLAFNREKILLEKQTKLGFCQVVEKVYSNRPSRLLYSGKVRTAQSGIALDDSSLMLFGYNQRFMEIIGQISNIKNILLIGGGVYTLPTAVSLANDQLEIDVVEPDKELDDIAIKYFGFNPKGNAKVHHVGGEEFLKNNKNKYDLIIVDAFYEDQIPDEIKTKDFAANIKAALTPDGYLAMNVISSLRQDSPLSICQAQYLAVFNNVVIYSADHEKADYYYDQNFILVAANQTVPFKLKYPPLASSINN